MPTSATKPWPPDPRQTASEKPGRFTVRAIRLVGAYFSKPLDDGRPERIGSLQRFRHLVRALRARTSRHREKCNEHQTNFPKNHLRFPTLKECIPATVKRHNLR